DLRRQHGRTSNLATIVDDDEPLFEHDAGRRLQVNDRRAVRGDVVGAAAHSIGDPAGDRAFHVANLRELSQPVVVAHDDSDHGFDRTARTGRLGSLNLDPVGPLQGLVRAATYSPRVVTITGRARRARAD